MHLKLLQNKLFKKEQKQLVILLVIKLLKKLQQSQELRHRIVKIQFQMKQKILELIEKY